MMQILDFCMEAKTFQEILEFTELKDRVSFKKVYIEPLMASGRLRMTDPDNPRSRKQQYITVEK